MARKPKKPKKDAPVTLAVLDATGLLTGFETGPAASAGPNRIVVPDGCDLTPGAYRWNGESFLPLAPATDAPPAAQRAMALCIAALAENRPVPVESVDWARWYLNSFDGGT